MDPVRNPFAPGAGNPPPELAGRSTLLRQADIAMSRIALGKPAQSLILVGLRGVGKTVLLVRMKEAAEQKGFQSALIEAHERKPLPELLTPALRSILLTLSSVEKSKELARRGLRILRGFLAAFKASVGDVEFGLSVEPEQGIADSGDLESDLPNLMVSVAEAAKAADRPVALLVDELQYLSEAEFSALIMSMHKIGQQNLPLILVGAGLPQILGLAGESKSYAERLFQFPRIGALEPHDARAAIVNPIISEEAGIDEAAVEAILEITERYPYFLQQWGHEAWNIAADNRITRSDVALAEVAAIRSLDQSFFRVRFDRCTPSEKKYMRALAELGPGSHRSGEIADKLGVKTTSVGPVRAKLIKKGMIYSLQHGETAFTVPLFDAYMRRAMPALS
jgi:hypothetical protein